MPSAEKLADRLILLDRGPSAKDLVEVEGALLAAMTDLGLLLGGAATWFPTKNWSSVRLLMVWRICAFEMLNIEADLLRANGS